MALVRANDQYTLCEFAHEVAYGTAPTYTSGTYTAASVRRFPFVAESIEIEQEVLPLSEEFTPFAGLSGVDLGKRRVRGSITVEPQYNSQWFWMLFGVAFSYENVKQDFNLMDVSHTTTQANAHIFNHGNILRSITLWVWKAGPGPVDGSHWVDQITGLYITKWSWEQPEGQRAKVVMEYIGKAKTTVASNSLTGGPNAAASGIKVAVQHLGTDTNAGIVAWGDGSGVPAELNLTGFTINVDRKIDDTSGAFINEILTANQPGIEGIREVKLSFTTNLEHDYNATGKPWPRFLLGSAGQSAMFIRYDSAVAIPGVTPASNYGIRFDLPGVVLTSVNQSVNKAGVQQLTAEATCPLASLTRMSATYDHFSTAPTDRMVDVRVATMLRLDSVETTAGLGEITDDASITGFGPTA